MRHMQKCIFLFLFLTAVFFPVSIRSEDITPDTITIYSKRTGEFSKVEKMGETLLMQGVCSSWQYDLTIVGSREDRELKQIQGILGGQPINGSLSQRGFDLKLQLNMNQNGRFISIKNVMEQRGERLDIEFNRTSGGYDMKEVLTAINNPNEIHVLSEDESGKTSFHIIIKKSEITLFGNLRGKPVDYTVTLPAKRKWITNEDLVIGSIHLALTGYFIM